MAFAAFGVFALTGSAPLTPALVFPAISLFQLLQFPLAVLPMVINQWVQAYVSIGRLFEFLTSPELQPDAVIREPTTGDGPLVVIEAADFAWSPASPDNTLTQISLAVNRGALVAVVGRVGSGKSSLLAALLGEMDKRTGRVALAGRIAYAAQSPWLLSASVRENILFGARYDEDAYQRVVAACALVDDFKMFADGDATEVGERGISLSGGQKARISLARAVYSRSDTYLLDDPLSSVDAHVAHHLFEQVIGPNGLLSGKARILCTNAIPFCQSADELILLREGRIVERGSFETVLEHDGELKKLIDEFGKQTSDDHRPPEDQEATPKEIGSSADGSTHAHTTDSGSSSLTKASSNLTKPTTIEKDEGFMRRSSMVPAAERKQDALRALRDGTALKKNREQKATGSVKKTIYRQYARATGTAAILIYLLTVALQPVSAILTSVWLKHWSSANAEAGEMRHVGFYLGVYALLGCLTSFLAFVNGIMLYTVCVIRSSRKLHDGMFEAVMRAPMAFFDSKSLSSSHPGYP